MTGRAHARCRRLQQTRPAPVVGRHNEISEVFVFRIQMHQRTAHVCRTIHHRRLRRNPLCRQKGSQLVGQTDSPFILPIRHPYPGTGCRFILFLCIPRRNAKALDLAIRLHYPCPINLTRCLRNTACQILSGHAARHMRQLAAHPLGSNQRYSTRTLGQNHANAQGE